MADKKKVPKFEEEHGESSSSTSTEKRSIDQIGSHTGGGPVVISREEYLQALKDLEFDRTQCQMKNNILHRRLAEYYKKRKLEQALKSLEYLPEIEEKYHQLLNQYQEMKERFETETADLTAKVHLIELDYNERLAQAETTFETLQNLEKSTGMGLIYASKGKPIADKTVDHALALQKQMFAQCCALRLRYIRARNFVTELEETYKKLEQIGPGLNISTYEQKYADLQNFLNKIEEREDELIKNRSRCTEHNMIVCHMREKLHHTNEVIDITECDLGDAEIDLLKAREQLGYVKGRRDKLRWALEDERVKAGLLTRKDLLHDFQDSIDKVAKLREEKERLLQLIEKGKRELEMARRTIRDD